MPIFFCYSAFPILRRFPICEEAILPATPCMLVFNEPESLLGGWQMVYIVGYMIFDALGVRVLCVGAEKISSFWHTVFQGVR
ncbi:hypothetical protein DL98DRAFT_313616 [Cadophora sp. DSE1049]|nr:hypothetical protein DL98DRAFT_313616 [Cadophora sp. DSE1049]